ncbi:ATP-binding protein [Actinomycetospora sp. CA-101289]|uniref:sensor histidine kinase n=1 Tax=Actinomycetospora sp. CA-101289 TaxID=3239893 RepID=UPI003D96958E
MTRVLDYLPRGDMVDDAAWQRRHRFLLVLLVLQSPALAIFGLALENPAWLITLIALIPVVTAAGGWFSPGRLSGSLCVTAGLTATSAGLVVLSGGSIEAHFSFFVIIGFLTLYQHWVPFVFNIVFTVISHGLGSALVPTLMFNHHGGQHNPWGWSLIHGGAVLLACLGVAIFCKITEDEQRRRQELTKELSDARVRQQEFTSELLLNLARRNQSMFHRQLDIINDLEERERDPDALADLFRLDHLATRVRRNAESLLVLSGEQPARVWSAPVALRDVVRAGVAETEDLDRVTLAVDERPRIVGSSVADVTHMIAELVENAARYSPPATPVLIQSRAYHRAPGAHIVIIEDTGIGMPPAELAAANELMGNPQEVDVSAAARRLGFHVVSRLAERHGIEVSLTPTPGSGVTAVLVLPAALFAEAAPTVPTVGDRGGLERVPASAVPAPRRGAADDDGRHGSPSSNGSNGTNGHRGGPASGTNGAPASGPIAVDGRHAWPGAPTADEVAEAGPGTDAEQSAGRRRAAHAASGEEAPAAGTTEATPNVTEVAPDLSGDGHTTIEHAPPPGAGPVRRGLIHPIVVPPPAPVAAETPTDVSGPLPAAPAPRRSEEDEPAAVGPNGLVLARRRPQSHLAPELIRRAPTAAAAPTANGGSHRRPGAPGADRGAMDALSAYQASRAAARSAIGADGSDPSREDHHPQRGTTTGSQT